MALERLVTILTGVSEPARPVAVPITFGSVRVGRGRFGIGREVSPPREERYGKDRSGTGTLVGIATPLSAAERDERSARLVRVGRAGNEVVGRSGNPLVGNSGVGITPPKSVGVGSPALGIETPPGSDGDAVRAVRASMLGIEVPGSEGNVVGIDAPGTDVRTMGVGMTPSVGSEAAERVGSVGTSMLGLIGGKEKAGEAEAWRTYAPSDSRMSWSIVELLWLIFLDRYGYIR